MSELIMKYIVDMFAVVAIMKDWNSAFLRECPKLEIMSLQIKNHVRIFQRGVILSPIKINGEGARVAPIGILEYLSQPNNS